MSGAFDTEAARQRAILDAFFKSPKVCEMRRQMQLEHVEWINANLVRGKLVEIYPANTFLGAYPMYLACASDEHDYNTLTFIACDKVVTLGVVGLEDGALIVSYDDFLGEHGGADTVLLLPT